MVALDAGVRRRALEAAPVLARMTRVRAAYVFGSHVEGAVDEWSDIDVALFLDGVEDWDMRRRARAMFQVQKEVGLDVEAHLFSASAFEHPEEGSFSSYIMNNGVRLDVEGIAT